MEKASVMKTILYGIGVVAALWAGLPDMVKVLIALMTADIITGMARAAFDHKITKDAALRGVTKKAGILLVVAVVYYIDSVLKTGLGAAVAGWYAAAEGISLVDNSIALGFPLPDWIKQLFAAWAQHDRTQPVTPPKPELKP
jgi:toxin secretion/phage lysis holin